MKRIDTINARENMFGIGKSGFHDNADLPGQDATYVSPEWFNAVQEELCNLLELRGITLDPASKRQLYDLLTTQADLEALADEIETNFIRKSQIVDNLTTNDSTKVASARTVKELQDNKLEATDLKDATTEEKGVVQLVNNLTTGGADKALSAEQGKILNDQAFGVDQTWQDVTAVRTLGTTYTNTTDKLKIILITLRGTSSSTDGLSITVDSKLISNILNFPENGYSQVFAFVPPKKTYNISLSSSASVDIKTWWEF